ncbi:hypothetical protein OCU04_007217 [Sclerotinia nivalis]|uniref:Thioester reductase (TE) domain-containing protein n=1 Tax=Sclerotinia nivalis TaxID=352851 RepID=A0A9X0AM90_9HELO|nr:hypothetical protein OCU04_007217 [Sclerotinia nivalis]
MKRTLDSEPRLIELMNSSTLGGMARIVNGAEGAPAIDWQVETTLPLYSSGYIDKEKTLNGAKKSNDLIIILAGATGYPGRHILSRLIEAHEVKEVHCLVRSETLSNSPLSSHPKVHYLPADLAQPNLGLSSTAFISYHKRLTLL